MSFIECVEHTNKEPRCWAGFLIQYLTVFQLPENVQDNDCPFSLNVAVKANVPFL